MILQEVCLSKQGSSKSSLHNESKASNIATTTATSSSWSRLKDSRIVRASREYGGKDRHSKVCTVKGLRDRRVRLSVPTAIQVYDLQDRLGFNQPSKVVDWLLHVAKHDIDDLPPLQFPQGSLMGGEGMDSDSDQRLKVSRTNVVAGKAKEVCEDGSLPYASQSQMNTCIGTQSPFFRVDPSNLSVFHIRGRSDGQTSQVEDWHNFSILPLQPALVYQPAMNMNARFFSSQNNEVKEQNNSNKFHPG